MSLTFPDNDNRANRIRELATEAQNDLLDAQKNYLDFQDLLSKANPKIASVYKEAGLTAPAVSSVDIFKDSKAATDDAKAVVEIVDIIADIASFIGTIKYLAPGAAKALVSTGIMSTETAAKVIVEFTIPLTSREVSITAGDIAGNVLGGMLGGVLVVGFDLGIDAIEGSIARDKMRTAIHQLVPIRLATRVSKQRAETLTQSIRSVNDSMDALSGAGVPLTDAILRNVINKDVLPAMQTAQEITPEKVAAELAALDAMNQSWTNEDN